MQPTRAIFLRAHMYFIHMYDNATLARAHIHVAQAQELLSATRVILLPRDVWICTRRACVYLLRKIRETRAMDRLPKLGVHASD